MRKAAKEDNMKGLERKSKVNACTHQSKWKLLSHTTGQFLYQTGTPHKTRPKLKYCMCRPKKYLVAGVADLEADPGLGAGVGAPRTHDLFL